MPQIEKITYESIWCSRKEVQLQERVGAPTPRCSHCGTSFRPTFWVDTNGDVKMVQLLHPWLKKVVTLVDVIEPLPVHLSPIKEVRLKTKSKSTKPRRRKTP